MDIIQKIINSVDDFPTLPTIYTALTDVMANPRSTPQDAANIILRDQSSASKILKTANSPIYGFLGRIDTITQAIFYIGFDEVKNLVIALSIIDFFKKTKFTQRFNPVDLWKHSIAVGVISRLLGGQLGVKNLENYFLAGILHDIGKLLFFRYLPQDYERALNYAEERQITIREAENDVLGITHTVAGELIAEKWKLPASIRNAIRYHTNGVVNGKVRFLPATIHVSNIVARMLEMGDPGDYYVPKPNSQIWETLALPDNVFSMLMPKIISDYHTSMTLFSID